MGDTFFVWLLWWDPYSMIEPIITILKYKLSDIMDDLQIIKNI